MWLPLKKCIDFRDIKIGKYNKYFIVNWYLLAEMETIKTHLE